MVAISTNSALVTCLDNPTVSSASKGSRRRPNFMLNIVRFGSHIRSLFFAKRQMGSCALSTTKNLDPYPKTIERPRVRKFPD
jgi:hypothetical protein